MTNNRCALGLVIFASLYAVVFAFVPAIGEAGIVRAAVPQERTRLDSNQRPAD